MKVLKVILAIVLAIILLTAECTAMGLFSVEKALDRATIKNSIAETDVVEQLVNEALDKSTVNMGGQYGDMVTEVLKTDAMTGFFTDYLVSAIDSQIYNKQYEEVADDELMAAFSQGIDEVNKSGQMTISEIDGEMIKRAMKVEAPDLTAQLNAQVNRYDSLSGELADKATTPDETMSALTSLGSKVGALAVCIIVCAILIVLFWRSKGGFIWCAAVTALASAIFGMLQMLGWDAMLGITASSPAEEMMLTMISKGFSAVSIAGFVITVMFIIAFIILRISDRRRSNNEDYITAAERSA